LNQSNKKKIRYLVLRRTFVHKADKKQKNKKIQCLAREKHGITHQNVMFCQVFEFKIIKKLENKYVQKKLKKIF